MTRILLAGDIHASKDHLSYLYRVAEKFDADCLFAVGDFGYWPRNGFGQKFLKHALKLANEYDKTLYWLDGNHEDHDVLDTLVGQNAPDENGFYRTYAPYTTTPDNGRLLYVPRGTRWEWDGVSFLAVGGAFSVDKANGTPGESWFAQEKITDIDVAKSIEDGKVDIMLTHDVPSVSPILEQLLIRKGRRYKIIKEAEYSRYQLERIRSVVRPKLLVHGHYHVDYRHKVDGTVFRGLDCDGTTGFSWDLVDTRDWK